MNFERQYIGARYVPILGGAWDINKSYEALTIVQANNNSYTSKKPVPPGINITNTEYWVVTGNFNGQVEEYRQEVEEYRQEVVELNSGIDTVKQHSLKFYGAVGDGVTDDSEAFKLALAGLAGDTLYIDRGTYRIAKSVTISSPITIIGGADSTLKLEKTLTIKHHVKNVQIRNVSFTGTTSPLIDCIGIGVIIDMCTFKSAEGNILKVRNHDNTIQNCIFNASGVGAAVTFDVLDGDDGVNWSVNNKFLNNTVYTEDVGILCTKTTNAHTEEGLTITGNTVLANHGHSKCVLIESLFVGLISDNILDLAGTFALEIGGAGGSISDVHVSGNYLAGDSYGLRIGGDNSPQGCTVTGNTVFSSNGGFLVQNSRETNIQNNTVRAADHSFNVGGTAHYVKIENNTFLDGTQMGMIFSPDKCFIRDNLCHHLSVNGTGTVNNPTYHFDSEGHMTVTNTENWSVWDSGNMIIK